MMNKNKINALHQATKTKRDETFIRVKIVLQVMQAQSLSINFEAVAKLAQVSKTWLYKEELISAEIKRARNKDGKIRKTLDYQSIIQKMDTEIITLKDKNKALLDELKKVKTLLEIAHGELYKLKNMPKIRLIT